MQNVERHFPRHTHIPLLVFLLLVAVPASAQTLGGFEGTITDISGAAIPTAKITVTNKATNATRSTLSNESGVYSIPALPPGTYDITAEKQTFRSVARLGVILDVQQTARVDFPMQVGELNQTISVESREPLLTTENATVGTVIKERSIEELPLNGRSFLNLIALSPNVGFGFGGAASRMAGERANQAISIAGQRDFFTRFTLDGLENTDFNFETYVLLPSVDALQEFKVQTGIYPAEFGREASQVNVSTKPGTNSFHGSVFEFLRNDKLDATQYAFTANRPKKPPFAWNQYGFALGGPVYIPKLFNGRNRLFFTSNFEGFGSRTTTTSFFNVPSTAMRAGNFNGVAQIFDASTTVLDSSGNYVRAPFPNDTIPASMMDKTALKLLEFLPPPNVATGSLVSNYQPTDKATLDKTQFIQRIDFVESSKSTWFGRYGYTDEVQVTPNLYENGGKVVTQAKVAALSNTRTFSPTTVNELRLGYMRFFNNNATQLAGTRDVMKELNIPGLPTLPSYAWGTPAIDLGFVGFGDDSGKPSTNNDYTFQWIDNFSWVHGKHAFRFGTEISRDGYDAFGAIYGRGYFSFNQVQTARPNDGTTGNSFASYLLGLVYQANAAAGVAQCACRRSTQAYYVDDTWRLGPRITLSMGLRYEYTPPWKDIGETSMNIYLPFTDTTPNVTDPSRQPVLVRPGSGDFYQNMALRFNPAIPVARDGRLGDSLIASDKNDFAPRLGIAWSPTDHWTIRTGGGVFYSQDISNAVWDMSRNAGGTRLSFGNPLFPDVTLSNPFPGASSGNVQVNTPFILANQYNRRTPYSIQYEFDIQRQMGKQTVMEVGYLGSISHKLEQLRFYNAATPSLLPATNRLPYPEFGLIQYMAGSGNGNYNALSVRFQRDTSRGLTFITSYTFSKSIDLLSGVRSNGEEAGAPQDPYNPQSSRGPSAYNVAHRLVASTVYNLPFGKGKPFLNTGGLVNAVLGGWQIGSIVTLQTGFPLTVIDGVNLANDNINHNRPNATGQPQDLPSDQRTPNHFFNAAAYTLQAPGTYGNLGRNTLTGPGIFTWDFSSDKSWHTFEKQELQFRFEGFNFANHPNWAPPNTTLTSPSFTVIQGTRVAMRQLQFALKYIF